VIEQPRSTCGGFDRCHRDGTIDTLVTGRPMVGGLALHVDAGS